MRYRILTLNNISARGLERLPRERYEVAPDVDRPDAVLVRSADMHASPIPDTVRAVGRAGVGVNNIPVAEFSKRGIPVFNAPGATSACPAWSSGASECTSVSGVAVVGILISCGCAVEFNTISKRSSPSARR